MAMDSAEQVLSHEKFIEIFGEYTDALGIKTNPKPEEWIALQAKRDTFNARLALEAEQKKIAEDLRLEQERIKAEQEEEKRKANLMKDYFKHLMKKDLTKYIGIPKKMQFAKAGIAA